MKRLFFVAASLLLTSAALAPSANAESVAVNTENAQVETYQFTPFQLVGLAYNGAFADQGISGFSRLIENYRFDRVNGEDVVQAAVEANRLPATALEDESYINDVTSQLAALESAFSF